ncbi:ASCH/PUA domain-containing protein [Aeromonas hydrophila]|uniref:ASCH/PUA domain-containing protein n=1 Tax=Aeromonas hydrophila TaxID=644 RepID=UPI001FC84CB5|nr:ASCH/PUA domain-containing protein [Aeromonas hydrophila]GKQ96004.1 hypothetical protein KAM461_02540 [Aeromonas hydrophila]
MKHELKIKPEYFAAVVNGEKTFEIRNNADRNFQVGDTLILKSWDGEFNGNFVERTISYITDFEQKPGYVVLGLANTREQELAEQLADATRQCVVMAELLREAIGEVPQTQSFPSRCDAVLAGKLPAPVSGEKRTITINGKGLLELVDFTCPDHETDLEQQETEIVLLNRGAFTSTDGEEMPAGVYAYLAEYPEEGLHGPIGGAA